MKGRLADWKSTDFVWHNKVTGAAVYQTFVVTANTDVAGESVPLPHFLRVGRSEATSARK